MELVNFTLYQGTCSIRNNVRDLLCLLTRDNLGAAEQLNTILVDRVTKGMKEQSINPSVVSFCVCKNFLLFVLNFREFCFVQIVHIHVHIYIAPEFTVKPKPA